MEGVQSTRRKGLNGKERVKEDKRSSESDEWSPTGERVEFSSNE